VVQIFGSRSDYQTYRGTSTLIDYFRLAQSTVEMAAYWIAYGVETQGLAKAVCDLLRERSSLEVTLAIVNPDSSHLDAMAKHLDMSVDDIRQRIAGSLVKLTTTRNVLEESARSRYHIKIYDSLPVASVIMLDRQEKDGRIQIDIKPYHAAQHDSFAIEVTRGQSMLYSTLTSAWGQLIDDAREVDGIFKRIPAANLSSFKGSDGLWTVPRRSLWLSTR